MTYSKAQAEVFNISFFVGLQELEEGGHLRSGSDCRQRLGGGASSHQRRQMARDPTGQTPRHPTSAFPGVSQSSQGNSQPDVFFLSVE